jgi:hypothetical protein
MASIRRDRAGTVTPRQGRVGQAAWDRAACDRAAWDRAACDRAARDRAARDRAAWDRAAWDRTACDRAVCDRLAIAELRGQQPIAPSAGGGLSWASWPAVNRCVWANRSAFTDGLQVTSPEPRGSAAGWAAAWCTSGCINKHPASFGDAMPAVDRPSGAVGSSSDGRCRSHPPGAESGRFPCFAKLSDQQQLLLIA